MNDNDAVIVATARTPIGRARKGSLVDMRPDDLSVQAFKSALDKAPGLELAEVEDLYLGCAEPHDEHGQNIARRVAVLLGGDGLPGSTVNRFCASSLQATRMAFHAIKAGEGNAYLVGGVECVSRYGDIGMSEHPGFARAAAQAKETAESGRPWQDPRSSSRLPDIYLQMGYTAEFVARQTGTSRKDQDEYAALSQRRAQTAISSGFFARETVPVVLPDGRVVDKDDSPRAGTTVEGLSQLNPSFVQDGTVTAGNACPLNDGASAAVVMSASRARELGLASLARIVSSGVSALSPEIMGLGPVDASEMALRRAGLGIGDMDIVELNEAFAAQVVPSARKLGIDFEKLNPHGGAIALGHPFGSTGVRMLTTLINGLETKDGEFGLATMCVGGGQGMAMVIERL
ncbi:acetyl-CoA C-acetyltransferase [Arthrobacter crystallopoietes]|uniref:acetyl-CoA C-acyltransferase n=1 Tax=Crystallibacter crystallopoietes TaxID=37928 RepID=A0A1H1CUJ5_9MICC|nr:acetyl-CoA C-acetyltransferase [Arthrobacter crystallopoietes]AUI50597.1 acetyl-CoA acetyltransferase [Arthrobacter crystallopoietes]SDQ67904.1 acetyl-CoA C-acetyltransferase [Arthrobacter crystallopoietes]